MKKVFSAVGQLTKRICLEMDVTWHQALYAINDIVDDQSDNYRKSVDQLHDLARAAEAMGLRRLGLRALHDVPYADAQRARLMDLGLR